MRPKPVVGLFDNQTLHMPHVLFHNLILSGFFRVDADRMQGHLIATPSLSRHLHEDHCIGTFVAGSIISIAAIPYDGYLFDRWSDNSTDNPKEILVDHDITLTAFFRFTNVDEHGSVAYTLYPNPADDMLHVEGLDGSNEIKIYNTMGMLVKSMNAEGDALIPVDDLSSGLYLLRIGQHTTLLCAGARLDE